MVHPCIHLWSQSAPEHVDNVHMTSTGGNPQGCCHHRPQATLRSARPSEIVTTSAITSAEVQKSVQKWCMSTNIPNLSCKFQSHTAAGKDPGSHIPRHVRRSGSALVSVREYLVDSKNTWHEVGLGIRRTPCFSNINRRQLCIQATWQTG